MKKGMSILKPDVRAEYLNNALREKVRYLRVPGSVGPKELERDVKNGAVHMREVAELVKKNSDSKYVVVTASSEEQGYLAISYLAACYNKAMEIETDDEDAPAPEVKDPFFGEDEESTDAGSWIQWTEDFEDEEDRECWEESPERVPIIRSSELVNLGNNGMDSMPGFYDNYQISMGRRNLDNYPRYWQECRSCPVCIQLEEQFGGVFNTPFSEDFIYEKIDYFSSNERVYILQIDRPSSMISDCFGPFAPDISEEDNLFITPEERLKNNLILNYTADSVTVELKPEEEKKYYKEILRSHITGRKMGLARGFSFDKIINMIIAMKTDKTNELIEKIFLYSMKDRKLEEGYQFRNEDFAFIDRFARTAAVRSRGRGEKPAMERLTNELIGMDEVKQQVRDVVNMLKFNKLRAHKGIRGSQYHNVHMMLGAPGTAKTTVAKLMGEIMVEEKLLADNRFICVNGAELKGLYVGHTAPKTKALFDNHDIIVIDEAYSLVDGAGKTDSYSNEAIAQLVIELENHADDRLIIFAGYGGKDVGDRDNRMKLFLDSNPGIKSRINSTFYFESYTGEEMVNIFKRIAKNENYRIQPGAEEALRAYFETRRSAGDFGNGREARSLLEGSILAMSSRLFEQKGSKKITVADMKLIHASDILQAIDKASRANEIQRGRSARAMGFR